jgi:hypothetical protein
VGRAKGGPRRITPLGLVNSAPHYCCFLAWHTGSSRLGKGLNRQQCRKSNMKIQKRRNKSKNRPYTRLMGQCHEISTLPLNWSKNIPKLLLGNTYGISTGTGNQDATNELIRSYLNIHVD